MIVHFETEELEYLYLTPQDEIRGKQRYPAQVITKYKMRIAMLRAINKLDELGPFNGLRFEYLKGDRKGQCSLRLNDQYRLIITPLNRDHVQVIINEISKHYE